MYYLLVTGKLHNDQPCQKMSLISEEEIYEFNLLCTLIQHKKDQTNWVYGIELIHNKDHYDEHHKIADLYPEIELSTILNFQYYLPNGITNIEHIKVISGVIRSLF